MRTVAIIQARMGSTRLPGKVLMDISGKSMLKWVVTRARLARMLDEVTVATSVQPADDAVVAAAEALGAPFFRGSENDVLDRYADAAAAAGAEAVVRLTADCPLIDPGIIDLVVETFLDGQPSVDYASNTLERTFPRGLDVEAFSRRALEHARLEAVEPYERTHVTPYVCRHPERFVLRAIRTDHDYSDHRWTVDTPEDLAVIRGIVHALGGRDDFGWHAAIVAVTEHPDLEDPNRQILQKRIEEG